MNADCSSPWLSDNIVRRQLVVVEAQLESITTQPVQVADAYAQLLSPQAKRIRPALVLLCARYSPNTSNTTLISAAVAVELVHEATLYHDDIVDEAPKRRGIPAAHRTLGTPSAELAGSSLLFAAATVSMSLSSSARRAVAATGWQLWRGIKEEIDTLGDAAISTSRRAIIMNRKTATVFRLAAVLGCDIANVPCESRRLLIHFTTRLGMAYQLLDDILDIVAPEHELGRPPGSDIAAGCYTLPVIAALRAPTTQREALAGILLSLSEAPNPSLLTSAMRLIEESGAISHSCALVDTWLCRCEADLAQLANPGHGALESMTELISTLRHRVSEFQRFDTSRSFVARGYSSTGSYQH